MRMSLFTCTASHLNAACGLELRSYLDTSCSLFGHTHTVGSLFGQFLWHWILTVGVPIIPQSLVWSLAVGLGFEAATVAPFVGSA